MKLEKLASRTRRLTSLLPVSAARQRAERARGEKKAEREGIMSESEGVEIARMQMAMEMACSLLAPSAAGGARQGGSAKSQKPKAPPLLTTGFSGMFPVGTFQGPFRRF